jgi:hypothetical protein
LWFEDGDRVFGVEEEGEWHRLWVAGPGTNSTGRVLFVPEVVEQQVHGAVVLKLPIEPPEVNVGGGAACTGGVPHPQVASIDFSNSRCLDDEVVAHFLTPPIPGALDA